MYRLDNEISKLILYCDANKIKIIDNQLIDKIVFGQTETNSFLFFDYFLKDKNKAIAILDGIHEDAVDFNQTL